MIKISAAAESDFDAVFEILMHEDVNKFMNYPILQKDEFQEIWRDIFARLQLWKEGDEILGLVVLSKGAHRIKHIVYIEKLAINQKLAKKGWGTLFFEKIILSLKAEGFAKIELGVEVDNLRAIALYQKFGFEVEGIRKNLLNREGEFIDNYYMAKCL